jgi:5-methyltetrahydropteroyltriglutamate--homocysteine methyltransferase
MEVLNDLAAIGYRRGVGRGVWDIHLPRVPPHTEIVEALRRAVAAVPARRLSVNPDCGLKTRRYPEVEASLRHLFAAAAEIRST